MTFGRGKVQPAVPQRSESSDPEKQETAQPNELAGTKIQSEDDAHLTGVKLLVLLIGLGLVTFLMALDVSVIATAVPSITARFHSTSDIGWYGAVYSFVLCSLQPFAGKIHTLFSLKWAFLTFITIFLLGSTLCAAATSSNMFIGGRAVAGAGSAGILSGAMSIIALVAPLRKRPLYIGSLTSLFGLSTVLGPILGGLLTTKASWRWCFIINLPGGVITIVLLVVFFKPPRKDIVSRLTLREKMQKLDLIGCALFMPSIVMIILAVQWGGVRYAWRSATTIGLICGFAVLITMFLVLEYHKGEEAMIPYSILLNRSIILSCLFSFLSFGAMLSCVFYLPEWFQIIKGASAVHSGVMQLPSILSQTLAAGISAILVTRIGYCNPFFFIGMALLCLAGGLLTTLTPSTSHALWISYQIIQGLGNGIAMQMPILAVQAVLESRPEKIATGLSVLLFFQYFGSSMFLSVALTVFQDGLTKALRQDAGLTNEQVSVLLLAGSGHARQVTARMFPDKMTVVLAAYNKAITRTFFLAITATILGFFLATGIEWKNIKGKRLIPVGDEAEKDAANNDIAEVGLPEKTCAMERI